MSFRERFNRNGDGDPRINRGIGALAALTLTAASLIPSTEASAATPIAPDAASIEANAGQPHENDLILLVDEYGDGEAGIRGIVPNSGDTSPGPSFRCMVRASNIGNTVGLECVDKDTFPFTFDSVWVTGSNGDLNPVLASVTHQTGSPQRDIGLPIGSPQETTVLPIPHSSDPLKFTTTIHVDIGHMIQVAVPITVYAKDEPRTCDADTGHEFMSPDTHVFIVALGTDHPPGGAIGFSNDSVIQPCGAGTIGPESTNIDQTIPEMV